jgi:hypothetical protein
MLIEDDESYKLFMKELDNLHSAILIYKKGINDEMEELKIIELIRVQLNEAVAFASSGAQIVSLSEFAKLKRDLEEMNRQVRQKRAAIQNIEVIMRDRSDQFDAISKKISNFKKKFNNANVLKFKREKT